MFASARTALLFSATIALVIAGGCAHAPRQPEPKEPPKAEQTPEQQVAALLNRLTDDLVHHRLPRVLNSVSNAYKDDTGRDFNGAKQYLSDFFRDYNEIHITRTPPRITTQGDEARSVESLGIVGEPASDKIPPFSYQGNITITLRQVERTWLITKVQLLH